MVTDEAAPLMVADKVAEGPLMVADGPLIVADADLKLLTLLNIAYTGSPCQQPQVQQIYW